MYRWLVGLLWLAACDGGEKDTSGDTSCGSTMAFVSGSVTGSSASEKSLAVSATSDSGATVEADWYGDVGGALSYELNLAAGSWAVQASTADCTGEAVALQAQACQEHTVDLVVSCR